jgi:hypothetical protein
MYPGEHELCDPTCTVVPGLSAETPETVAADGIGIVWRCLCLWIEESFDSKDVGILVVYNGETCNLKWLWTVTQAPRSTLSSPDKIKYFLDPMKVILEYTSAHSTCNREGIGGLLIEY